MSYVWGARYRKPNNEKKLSGQRGGVLLESALVLPVIFLGAFGMAQYGLIFLSQMTLRDAAAYAARQIYLQDSTNCSTNKLAVQNATIGHASTLNPKLQVGDIDLKPFSSTTGGVTITGCQATITYSYRLWLSRYVPGGSTGSFQLTAKATFG